LGGGSRRNRKPGEEKVSEPTTLSKGRSEPASVEGKGKKERTVITGIKSLVRMRV